MALPVMHQKDLHKSSMLWGNRPWGPEFGTWVHCKATSPMGYIWMDFPEILQRHRHRNKASGASMSRALIWQW